MLLFVGSLLPNVERKTLALLKITCNGQLLAFMCYLPARFNEKGVYPRVIFFIGSMIWGTKLSFFVCFVSYLVI